MDYPKSLGKGKIKIIVVGLVNGYEIVNEFLPKEIGEGFYFNNWYLLDSGKQVSKKIMEDLTASIHL